jgi:RNA polymerase sigma-70 factor (ECF subfamily)
LAGPACARESEKAEERDRDWVERTRAGDRSAFEAIVRCYQRRVYGLALRMTRRHEVADEITQEAFVRAYTHLDRFQLGRPLAPWLLRITMNLTLNHLSSGPVRREETVPDPELSAPPRPTPIEGEPLRSLLSAEFQHAFEGAVERLPPEQKAVFVLKVQEEMRYEEIADTLGISLGTVMSRLSRARAKLKTMLRDYL